MAAVKLLGGIIAVRDANKMLSHQKRMLANAMLEAYPMSVAEVEKAVGVAHRDMNKAPNRTRIKWSRKKFFRNFPEVRAANIRWWNMVARTGNPEYKGYKYYGGRGIKLHQPWRESFWCWYEYVRALPNHATEGYTLDRIDNDGHYEPGNLRYATYKQQANNKRNNIKSTGEKL